MDRLQHIQNSLASIPAPPWRFWQGCYVTAYGGAHVVLSSRDRKLLVNVDGRLRPIEDGRENHPVARFFQEAPQHLADLLPVAEAAVRVADLKGDVDAGLKDYTAAMDALSAAAAKLREEL